MYYMVYPRMDSVIQSYERVVIAGGRVGGREVGHGRDVGGCKWGSVRDPRGDGNTLDLDWIRVCVLAVILYCIVLQDATNGGKCIKGIREILYFVYCIL